MKILLSAFSCHPGKGSEPGIGWNTARRLADHHEVWVITRPVHRPFIAEELEKEPVPNLHFVYYRVPILKYGHRKRSLRLLKYYLWQAGIYFVARNLHKEIGFDIVQHVTLCRRWTPSFLAQLPPPFIWGNAGGGEAVPANFRKELPFRLKLEEKLKDLAFGLCRYDPFVRLTARKSALILATSEKTASEIRHLTSSGIHILGEALLDEAALAPSQWSSQSVDGKNPPCFGTFTRLVHWKGIHLGLRAFALLEDKHSRYWIVGKGPEKERLKKLAYELDIAERVVFWGNPSREEWFRLLHKCRALIHPCLCNSGGMISLEAMAAGLPVICLNLGAIMHQVTEDSGIKVSAQNSAEAVAGLAKAMNRILHNPDLAMELGQHARERACKHFTWEARIGELNRLYTEIAADSRNTNRGKPSGRNLIRRSTS